MAAVQSRANGNAAAVRPTSSTQEEEENIFLFIPNLIGEHFVPSTMSRT
jgi:hypothetical protein